MPGGVLDLELAQPQDPLGVDPALLVHLEGVLDQGADLGAGIPGFIPADIRRSRP
jgi:hypothetical protein